MNVSRRGQDIQASPIRKLKPYADAAKAKGIKVIHLNIGDPDIPMPMPVLERTPSNRRTMTLKHLKRQFDELKTFVRNLLEELDGKGITYTKPPTHLLDTDPRMKSVKGKK